MDGIRRVDYGREGKVESRGASENWVALEPFSFYSWSSLISVTHSDGK